MTILIYNVRVLGASGRRQQVWDVVCQQKVEIICLHETIKAKLSRRATREIGGSFSYDWNIKPASGHSGGLLIAVRSDLFEVLHKDQGDFYVTLIIRNIDSNLRWEIINVYGPVQYDRKDAFLAEITDKVLKA